jgi:sporulation protein YlmC with PRC-barrel domain
MEQISKRFFIIAVAAVLTPLGAMAQSATSSQNRTSQTGSNATEVRGSKIVGATLKSSDGSDLGEVRDLAVDPRSGKIDFAIIGVEAGGGAEALAPVPWKAINLKSERDFSATINKQKLQSGPTITEQQWSQLVQPDYVLHIYRFYGIPNEAMGGGQGEEYGGAQSGGSQSGQSPQSGSSSQSGFPRQR